MNELIDYLEDVLQEHIQQEGERPLLNGELLDLIAKAKNNRAEDQERLQASFDRIDN